MVDVNAVAPSVFLSGHGLPATATLPELLEGDFRQRVGVTEHIGVLAAIVGDGFWASPVPSVFELDAG